MSARACICRWPPCFSRPTGSILGLLYGTALASPHRSGPSKLPGHVSLRRFETAKLAWSGIFCLTSLACYGLLASLQPSKLPGHVSLRGFETATWHVLARLEKPKKPKTSNSVKLARLCQHEPASVDGRPASAAQLGLFWVYIRHSPCLTSLLWPLQAAWACIFQAFRSCLSCLVKYLLHHVSGLLRPPCLTPAFQGAWSCIFKGFRNCYVARFSQALKALKPPKTSNSVKLARLCQHEPASVDGRPASAANWVYFGSIYSTALPHLTALAPPSCLGMYL